MAIAGTVPSSPFLGHLPFHFGKSSSVHFTHNSVHIFKVKALFWGSRTSGKLLSLGEFTLSPPDSSLDDSNNILGVVPLYLKSHSYGEYVFDHSWANAYYSYGLSYYPKLQCSVPFTPVTGPRILVPNTSHRDQVFDILVSAMKDLAVKAIHWDTFYKWGTAYLTRDFFHCMGAKMGDNVLLVVAEEGDELVAAALYFIGGDTLYGRLWGCLPGSYYANLHFEACYYQAIDAAIELNLSTVEAGAQGEHKIQRGYMPVTTYSCHYVKLMKLLQDSGPFKENVWN
ncbi:unnamed protein product [Withania somnifera]